MATEPQMCPVCGSHDLNSRQPSAFVSDRRFSFRVYCCANGHTFMIPVEAAATESSR